MTGIKTPTTDTANRDTVISRVVDASRGLVFRMFTDPKHVGNGLAPYGFMSQPTGPWNGWPNASTRPPR